MDGKRLFPNWKYPKIKGILSELEFLEKLHIAEKTFKQFCNSNKIVKI